MARNKIAKIILISIIVLSVFYFIGNSFIRLLETEETLPTNNEMPPEHIAIISEKFRHRIAVRQILRTKYRNVSFTVLDSSYSLVLFEIGLIENLTLSDILQLELTDGDKTVRNVYFSVNNDYVSCSFKSGKLEPAKEILLTLFGDSVTPYLNSDSVIAYQLNFKNLTIRYSKQKPVDIYIHRESPFGLKSIPVSLLFLQRDNSVFVMLLYPLDATSKVSPFLLQQILNSNGTFH